MKIGFGLAGADIARIEEDIECRLGGRIRNFHLQVQKEGLVLSGRAPTFYAKQLAQHLVMQATNLPIQANNILVT